MEIKFDGKKLNFDMITGWGQYKWQCDMEVIYSAYKDVQIIN